MYRDTLPGEESSLCGTDELESEAGTQGLDELDADSNAREDEEQQQEAAKEVPTGVFRAMMRFLRDAPPEERRAAIAGLPQDRFMDLINFIGTDEGGSPSGMDSFESEPKNGAASEEGITSEDGDEEDEDSEEEAAPASAEEVGLSGQIGTGLADRSRSSTLCVADDAEAGARNTQPLGQLQLDGCGIYAPAARAPLAAAAVLEAAGLGMEKEKDDAALSESGIDGKAVRSWLVGEISGGLCRARVLEAVARGKFCQTQAQREVSRTAELYGEAGAGLGGCLGALAGGFAAIATLGPGRCGAGGVLEAAPEAAVQAAAAALRPGSEAAPPPTLHAETLNFEFRRRCLQAHPQREFGNLISYLQVHCHQEIVRQSLSLASRPFSLCALDDDIESTTGTGGFSEIDAEFGRSDVEADKAAEGLSFEELEVWNENMNRYLLDLAWQKDSLQSILAFLRANEAYAVLGVPSDVCDAELTRAYKAAAMRSHPDKGGDAEQFKVLRGAYEKILAARRGSSKGGSQPGSGPSTEAGHQPEGRCPQSSASRAARPAADLGEQGEDAGSRVAGHSDGTREAAGAAAEEVVASSHTIEEEVTAEETSGTQEAGTSPDAQGVEDTGAAEAAEAPPPPAKVPGQQRAAGAPDTAVAEDARGAAKDADGAAVVAAIPVEAISRHAEHALNGAEMCVNVGRLAEEAADAGGIAWPQLLECGTHLLDSAHCVTEASRNVAQFAVGLPASVMPLLESTRSRKGVTTAILTATRDLMRCTEVISERGLRAATLSDKLLMRSRDMVEALKGVAGALTMSDFACRAMAETLGKVAACARDAADAAAAAAVVVGDAQRHAETLADLLDRTRRDDSEEEGEQQETKANADNADAETDDGSDEDRPETSKERRASNRRLLQKLNGEILGMQQEMRSLVSSNPQLIPKVGVAQKDGLFALVAEVVRQVRSAVSRAWCDAAVADVEASTGTSTAVAAAAAAQVTWVRATEGALRLVRSAGDWDHVASPPFEARILRAAALVDAPLLSRLLRRELLEHCMALAPEGMEVEGSLEVGNLRDVGSRFSAAITALCRHSTAPAV